ncbi:MAG: DPP IV N-terminal domain-containing protein [Planctomycetota bacterium]|nr:DPP IV N-terminal domain-containing protein [Planctomycetota bacterium]
MTLMNSNAVTPAARRPFSSRSAGPASSLTSSMTATLLLLTAAGSLLSGCQVGAGDRRASVPASTPSTVQPLSEPFTVPATPSTFERTRTLRGPSAASGTYVSTASTFPPSNPSSPGTSGFVRAGSARNLPSERSVDSQALAARESVEAATQTTHAREGSDLDPCVTPDGKTLVFSSTQHAEDADIYSKPVDGRAITRLTNDAGDDIMPSVSPDGSRIAFASNRNGNWDIFVMPINGGKAVQVTDDLSDELHPSWSSDGSRLVFSRLGQVSERWELWVNRFGSPGAGEFIGFGLFPKWCPVPGTGANGADQILFQLSRERGSRSFAIWTVDYKNGQTANATEIVSSTGTAMVHPAWSPDGKFIAFSEIPIPTSDDASRPEWAHLWIVGSDGQDRVQVAAGPSTSLMPSWASDQRIFFVSDRGGVENVWAIDSSQALAAISTSGVHTQLSNARPNARHSAGAHAAQQDAHAQENSQDHAEQPEVASAEDESH